MTRNLLMAAGAALVLCVSTAHAAPPAKAHQGLTAEVAALLAQAVVLRVAVSRRHEITPSPPRVVVLLVAVVAVCLGSVLLPQTIPWNVLRFAVAVACLAPFTLALRRLQRGVDRVDA